MPMWGKTDEADGSPIFAPAQVSKAPTRAAANTLFSNVTANAYMGSGETIGLYLVSDAEVNMAGIYRVTAATPNNAGTGYLPGDVLTVANTGAGDSNTIVEANLTVDTTEIASITLNGVGTGGSYKPGDLIQVGTGTATVNAYSNITATKIRTVAVNTGGTGYANGDTIRVNQGSTQTTNCVFTVTTGAADTIIASLALTNGVFTVNPTALTNANTAVITGTGTGGTVDVTMRIATISAIQERGSFTTNPTASGGATTLHSTATGNGTGATVDTTVRIETLSVANAGSYLVTTNVTAAALVGGTGSSATAVLTELLFQAPGKAAGTGWVLRTEGAGNRVGRVHNEVLVALSSTTGDASDDTRYPD